MKINVLLIEDNPLIHRMMAEAMTREGLTVFSAFDGYSGLDIHAKQQIDIIVLDLMLPDLDGETVLLRIRKDASTPILIASSKDSDIDKAVYLGLGADDYLAKPVSMIELVAHIKAVVRRSKMHTEEQPAIRRIGDLEFKLDNFEAYRNGVRIPLTLKESRILEMFFANPNTTFTKKQVYEAVWKAEYYHDDNVINVQMRRIREKLEVDPAHPEIIKTVWGIGYQYNEKRDKQE